MQLRAENELREKTKLLKNQYEAESKELRSQHERGEERQKALLQLQWKVMSDQPQEDQEDLPYIKATQSPVTNMLKEADKGKPGNVINIPKHSKKDSKKNKRQTPKANTPRTLSSQNRFWDWEKPDCRLVRLYAAARLKVNIDHRTLNNTVSIRSLNEAVLVIRYLEWLLAITYVGGIVATLSYQWSLEEALLAMKGVKPVMLATDNEYTIHAHCVPSLIWHVLMYNNNRYNSTENISLQCLLRILLLGTTGKSKGVMLSHSAFIVQSLAKIATVGYNEDDVQLHICTLQLHVYLQILHTTPLGHVRGLSSALTMLMVQGCHVLMPKFEAN
ncbi:hypothetical protein M8C21_027386 [Ambrosia artemisiifolia]|uniref:AMP-dependent synthetase/ligase domain-containing protein n=1 Tax=Ambrosia artemisiifolia TaxID=4212 RepID=A0AAD5GD60_AMBAR|nr:hypothetical protein M8C21_027386 [Ambrosia artemisiifolia]